MKRRTIDELVSYVEGFLNELYSHFSPNGRVLFRELQIEKNGTKYHLNGRLRCEIMKAEFNESHRYYTRKFDTPPTREAILSWIQASYELRVTEYKRNFKKDIEHHNEILKRRKERYSIKKKEKTETQKAYYYKNRNEINRRRRELRKTNGDDVRKKRNEWRAAHKDEVNQKKKKWIKGKYLLDFDTEFEKARPMVYNYLRQITRSKDDLDDLMQDIYLMAKTKKGYGMYKRKTNMSAWLIKFGINLNLRNLKRRRKEKEKFDYYDTFHDNILEMVDKASITETEEKENEVQYPDNGIQIIQQCIDELSDVQKEQLELWVEGNSHQEIADMMGIDVNYSKTRLYLIRKVLAKSIEPKLNVNVNRKAHKKSYYFRNKLKNGKSINVGEKESETKTGS
jgi:RNA polymerase sigma factor (sigma-70 family)